MVRECRTELGNEEFKVSLNVGQTFHFIREIKVASHQWQKYS